MSGVATIGTGKSLQTVYKFTEPMAGKTGTTQSASDGWFIGGTPDLVCAVWTGAEDRTVRQTNWTGAHMSLPTWGLFMRKVYDDRSIKINRQGFERPENINVEIECGSSVQDEPIDYDN